ncbi:uncharacterized protein [Anabrus simplex]|uniref:uncharacterized protein n=1 Tax=Anabrus simplex TaxID=316456 RepID=UPI0035A2CE22
MDLEVVVKKEIVWPEEIPNTPLDSHRNNAAENGNIIKIESQTSVTPKVENDAIDPITEDQIMLPSTDIKYEIFIEEQPVPAPCLKEENNMENAELSRGPVLSCNGYCKTPNTVSSFA